MGTDERTSHRELDDAAPRGKRPYRKPAIREYGIIAKLTQSGGSTKPEAGTMKSGVCL